MKSDRKKAFSRILIYLLLAILAGAGIFLFLPSNSYVRRALIHQLPKIDQYPVFENRVVKAGKPRPWAFVPDTGDKSIPAGYEADFAKYETVAFVVIQHGKIVFEKYWDHYSPMSYSNSFSMAKSVVSLLVGCAIHDGAIKSVEQPVSDFFPEWTSYGGRQLLIKDLLTMSAGLAWDEAHASLFSKTTEAYYGNDLWKVTLTETLVEKPGVTFNYQSGATQLLAFVLAKATGKPVAEYASEKIWTPIEAEYDALWSLDRKNGMEKAYCCFNSNARDFARLGQLVLNNGKWNGRQVVDSGYIKQATSPATWLLYTPGTTTEKLNVPPRPCTIYGYQFWLLNYKGLKIPYMRGILGQYIFVIPELDAVVVRLGKKRDEKFIANQVCPVDALLWLDAALDIINRQ